MCSKFAQAVFKGGGDWQVLNAQNCKICQIN